MYTSETSVRVRYAETDQMGYVYYAHYAMYYEVARVESLRQLGLTYKEIEHMGVMMPVLENHTKFKAPAYYDELLRIRTTIKEMPSIRITFFYEIYNEHNKLINEGETRLVFVDMKTKRPCSAPQAIVNVLAPYFNEIQTS
jgi:acyl-CoA thioester hydrolase